MKPSHDVDFGRDLLPLKLTDSKVFSTDVPSLPASGPTATDHAGHRTQSRWHEPALLPPRPS